MCRKLSDWAWYRENVCKCTIFNIKGKSIPLVSLLQEQYLLQPILLTWKTWKNVKSVKMLSSLFWKMVGSSYFVATFSSRLNGASRRGCASTACMHIALTSALVRQITSYKKLPGMSTPVRAHIPGGALPVTTIIEVLVWVLSVCIHGTLNTLT